MSKGVKQMAGTEKITQRILQQAQEQAAELRQQAEQAAAQAKQRACAKAEQDAQAIAAQGQTECRERQNRIIAVADLEMRKRRLAAKRQVLDEAFEAARTALAQLPEAEYRALYIKAVLAAVEKGDEQIAPAQADVQRLGQDFVNLLNQALQRAGRRAEVTLAHERTDIAGGCVVCSGGMEVDCSHQALLRAVREKTEGEINHMLFAQEG